MSWRRKEPGHQQPWYWVIADYSGRVELLYCVVCVVVLLLGATKASRCCTVLLLSTLCRWLFRCVVARRRRTQVWATSVKCCIVRCVRSGRCCQTPRLLWVGDRRWPGTAVMVPWGLQDVEALSTLLDLYEENLPITGGFPSQRPSNAELWGFLSW